jgi:phosphoesterase RecJ-like protein
MPRASLHDLADWLKNHDNYAITSHVSPDGDAIGSALGLMLILRGIGKRCYAVMQDPVPDTYLFLPNAGDIVPLSGIPYKPEYVILVDCAERGRVGNTAELLDNARGTACIDHHLMSAAFGSVNHIDSGASATGELIIKLADAMHVPLSQDIASCLYTAIVTDCGNFGFSSTTSETLTLAARCVSAGLDISTLNYRLFREKSAPRVKILGLALSGIEYIRGGKVAIIRVTHKMKRECCAISDDLDGLVNYGVDTRGVEVALLAEEIDEGSVAIGLRSKHYVNVAEAAAALGGGGHARASGATLKLSIDESIARALYEIDARLGA